MADDRNPLLEPRVRVAIPLPHDDPRALATAEVSDPEDLDPEDRRRLLSMQRRVLQRIGRRRQYMAEILAVDPALHDELAALRRLSPQAFRKRLQHEARRLGIHVFRWHGPRDLPLDERENPEPVQPRPGDPLPAPPRKAKQ